MGGQAQNRFSHEANAVTPAEVACSPDKPEIARPKWRKVLLLVCTLTCVYHTCRLVPFAIFGRLDWDNLWPASFLASDPWKSTITILGDRMAWTHGGFRWLGRPPVPFPEPRGYLTPFSAVMTLALVVLAVKLWRSQAKEERRLSHAFRYMALVPVALGVTSLALLGLYAKASQPLPYWTASFLPGLYADALVSAWGALALGGLLSRPPGVHSVLARSVTRFAPIFLCYLVLFLCLRVCAAIMHSLMSAGAVSWQAVSRADEILYFCHLSLPCLLLPVLGVVVCTEQSPLAAIRRICTKPRLVADILGLLALWWCIATALGIFARIVPTVFHGGWVIPAVLTDCVAYTFRLGLIAAFCRLASYRYLAITPQPASIGSTHEREAK